jgi:SAM-dependent methyltransferase
VPCRTVLAVELEDLQRHWQAFGEQDSLWAILTAPDKRGGGWQLSEFLATEPTDVAGVLGALAQREIAIGQGRALDFGCGVGRLTRVLAEHFDRCDGVDVAASMIKRASSLNRHPDRVRFHDNQSPDLRPFEDGSFTFVLSLFVLQHMEPELMRGYLREFIRVLHPEGVAYFNIPERIALGAAALPSTGWRASLALTESFRC